MKIKNVLVLNGKVVGATIENGPKLQKAKLADVMRLIKLGKITDGARIINDRLYFSDEILKNMQYLYSTFELKNLIRDENDKITGGVLQLGNASKECNSQELWSLAADDRINGVTVAYIRETNDKVIISNS